MGILSGILAVSNVLPSMSAEEFFVETEQEFLTQEADQSWTERDDSWQNESLTGETGVFSGGDTVLVETLTEEAIPETPGQEESFETDEPISMDEIMTSPALQVETEEIVPEEFSAGKDAELFAGSGGETADAAQILFTELSDPSASGTESAAVQSEEQPEEEDPALFTGPLEELEEWPEPEAADSEQELLTALVYLPETYLPTDLPPVRSQYTTGMCWAFTTAASMEIWLKQHGAGDYDLSEEHLGYFLLNREDDPLHQTAGDTNAYQSTAYAYPFRHGGSQILASLGLSTWSGFDLEENAPLGVNEKGEEIAPNLDPSRAYATTAYLTEAAFATSSAQYKDMINEYGSVGVSLRYDKSYLKKDDETGVVSYSYPESGQAVNHAVTLVGWDDTFSKDHFAETSKVASDGAYLARNSWGSGWGDQGYFYISYECQGLKNAVSVRGTTEPKWKNNYFYDGTDSLYTSDTLVLRPQSATVHDALANVFEVKAGNGMAEALGEVVICDYKAGGSYGIQIYTNLTDPSDPDSGKAVYETPLTYTKTYAGIGTFTLPQELVLAQNSFFSVVVTNLGTTEMKVLKEKSGTGSSGQMVWTAQIDQKQSFQSTALAEDGSFIWTDLAGSGSCARIKAHTRTLEEPVTLSLTLGQSVLKVGETTRITAKVGGGLVKGTYILTLGSSNKNIASVSSTGEINAVAPGTVTITSSIKGTTIISTAELTVEATPTPVPTATPIPTPTSTPTPVPTATPSPTPVPPTPVPTATPVPARKPAAPASLTAKALDYHRIRLDFAGVDEADGYYVYRKEGNTDWVLYDELSASTLSFIDQNANTGIKYRYRVRAFTISSAGRLPGDYSPTAAAKTVLSPTKKLKAKCTKTGQSLQWKKVSGADGYEIWRKKGSGAFKKLVVIKNGKTVKYLDRLTQKGTYTYRIRAYRIVKGKKKYSAYKKAAPVKRNS